MNLNVFRHSDTFEHLKANVCMQKSKIIIVKLVHNVHKFLCKNFLELRELLSQQTIVDFY